MDIKEKSLKAHYDWSGKIEIISRAKISNKEELAVAYTPGVAEACLAIKEDKDLSFKLTRRWNTVAVITDGTAVLGLGDIGPQAAMPVMEGKCCLFKEFADIDAFPLCINSKNIDEIVQTIQFISGSFGGINLEDISAPRCFEIERRLKEICDIPIFHDDQHGTAIVVLAGLINSLRIVNKDARTCRIVISGAGAAGSAISRLLMQYGFYDIVLCDKEGALCRGKSYENENHLKLSQTTNPYLREGSLEQVLQGADIFIGVSAPNIVTKEMISSMANDPIIFAMANPIPEIMPEDAKAAGARIIATGRSDYENQINNVLAFPGIFRGALDSRARYITEKMKLAAAIALANIIPKEELCENYIIPSPFDKRVVSVISEAVKNASV